jgi:hypothetical protein
MQETQPPATLQKMFSLPRDVRRKGQEREEGQRGKEELEESERGVMGKIMHFPRKERVETPQECYVYGETILSNWSRSDALKDSDGCPVKAGEFYKVTPTAIERIR